MVVVAEAQVSDILAIKHVLCTTWRDTYRSLLGNEVLEQVAENWHSQDALRNEIENDAIYSGIARSDQGEIVAMITAHEADSLLFVSRLYVLPSHQRRGIGYRLLSASFDKFPDAKAVQLDVEVQNPKARAFYRELGFVEIQRKSEVVFGTVLHSIVLERDIASSAT